MKMSREDILQCLMDSGCDEITAGKVMNKLEDEDTKGAMKLLGSQRKDLLDGVHEKQKCIDCLDYLTWQMKKSW